MSPLASRPRNTDARRGVAPMFRNVGTDDLNAFEGTRVDMQSGRIAASRLRSFEIDHLSGNCLDPGR